MSDRGFESRIAVVEARLDLIHTELDRRLSNQDRITTAQVVSAKEALAAALASSEKALEKLEVDYRYRFASVNEFRAQANDLIATFARIVYVDLRFEAVEKRADELRERLREIDLKFGGYTTLVQTQRYEAEVAEWRRSVDRSLTASQSKAGLIAGIVATALALGGLFVAVLNFIYKAPVVH